jgi:hypothetical protein
LFEHQPNLITLTRYEVQSSVPVEIFELFVKALESGAKVPITNENAGSISFLAKEFCLEDLLSECSALQISSTAALSERISKLECQIFSQPLTIIAELKGSVLNHDRQLESLSSLIEANDAHFRTQIDDVRHSAELLQTGLETMKSRCERTSEALVARIASFERRMSETLSPITGRLSVCERGLEQVKLTLSSPHPSFAPTPSPSQPIRVCTPPPVPPVSPSKSHKGFEFPLKEAKSLDGIISYLTRKHAGNVHDKGIVTITSKSVRDDPGRALGNIADLTADSRFCSKDEPGQWVCWDFHEMRVRPTHYTIKAISLNSWVVESSLDFVNWTEIDRTTGNNDFRDGWGTASYAVSNAAECRFIRLTQTGKNNVRRDALFINAFEVFGALLE